ncbi:DUF881 domain-containing protein [Fodinibacter luteus]|uniref:DUF881 domain-containing protein n=1 Tax=Fodinibacter luteus TaxID=552064 RepID=A0ABP8KEN2_9MICO
MSAPAPPQRRPDESMTLLTTMIQRPLDPGYAAAADRREAQGMPRATSLRSPRLLVATLLLGLVVGVASYNLTAADTPRAQARAELIGQIEDRRAQVEELTARATALQSEVTALEAAQLGGAADAERSRELAAAVGALPLEGPGFTVTLDDAPGSGADEGAESGSDEAEEGQVFAKDLQFVTNALWESGAEAVSINGQRLTATSAIRFAGSAIIVDYRPLTRPYVITALGDPQRFPADFADGPGGTYLSTLRQSFGIRVDTEVSDELTVPAAVGLTTRWATTGDTGDAGATPGAAPSPSVTPERSPS